MTDPASPATTPPAAPLAAGPRAWVLISPGASPKHRAGRSPSGGRRAVAPPSRSRSGRRRRQGILSAVATRRPGCAAPGHARSTPGSAPSCRSGQPSSVTTSTPGKRRPRRCRSRARAIVANRIGRGTLMPWPSTAFSFSAGRTDGLSHCGRPSCVRGFFISRARQRRMSEETIDDQPAGSTATAGLPRYRYDARLAEAIELRWQEYWAASRTFESPNPVGPLADGFRAGQPKSYVLDMFPYASGAGLHVGHPEGYIATDVYARYLRMTGHHVLHAMGFDSFGLPAEQYALSTGQHPHVTTRQNTDKMRQQLRRLGLGHDARRSVDTTDPRFYRWTQWIFLKIFHSWVDERTGRARPIADLVAEYESGQRPVPGDRQWTGLTGTERRQLIDSRRLAYVAEEPVNWCPGLGTVLANEEVTADGRSDIGNFPVYRRPMRQWMLRITAMAQRLIDDLDALEWPENVKHLQRNWIGASDGAVIWLRMTQPAEGRVEVFTTRPDTLRGATYVVLAPEHPLIDTLVADAWPEGTPARWRGQASRPGAAVSAYRDAAAQLTDRQRATGAGAKTGVFTGSYLTNPVTGEAMPVFIADYVLMGYGTGAIMAVPAHDERDREF